MKQTFKLITIFVAGSIIIWATINYFIYCHIGYVCSDYKNIIDARADKLFERGWLPDILPNSTTKIETINDLDLNTSSGSFIIPESDIEQFTKQLKFIKSNVYYYESYGSGHGWEFTITDDRKVSYFYE